MANFYTDTPELRFHLNDPLMKRIVELKERNFADKDQYDYAPVDFEDAMDSYERVLQEVGDICANIIAPNAEQVDLDGCHVENKRAVLPKGTIENLEATKKAGLNGISMPRRLGGLNFPIVPYMMAADIVSRSDAGFENLWGLQDCAETIYEFGSEEQKQKYITRACNGDTMSMDLTEPDAGSDLQAVMLKATYNEEEDCWYLNGVKRFITNGDSDIHLVLARSEEGTHDGRGLSMFIYDKRNGGVDVRRIENKMGIKGVPACELTFKNAKAELVGSRKLGLIKYVMALMNGARLGISAQSVGISQAAYNEALSYARERRQFGKAIIDIPAVAEMLTNIKTKLDASRALLYETSRYVDMYKVLDDIAKERKLTPEERAENKKYAKWVDSFTPLAKGIGSEFANQNVYDCVQVHGGSGFMKDYACERLHRDVRITSIYEGTTQLQVVAAIRYVTNGTYLEIMKEMEQNEVKPEMQNLMVRLHKLAERYALAVTQITEKKDQELLDFMSRRLVEMAAYTLMGHLLVRDASRDSMFDKSANVFVRYAEGEFDKHIGFIEQFNDEDMAYYRHN
ncbi:acyl-CoA dehydrogenase [Porphyromonas macacae]|uniref:Acyl-CoA dehydrogenase n=1 Tax=Porphyromonas macacae TaxID=28115 RepID=A0A0A2E918_9PORP|nr:acyl-CoA dehydrogenase family protein [Porphyromonas macacae]KGN72949.1 acyl-CoA dehydrogenase [Porphyromonas macacae]